MRDEKFRFIDDSAKSANETWSDEIELRGLIDHRFIMEEH